MARVIRLMVATLFLALVVGVSPAAANRDEHPPSKHATYYLSLGDSLAASAQPVGNQRHGYVEVLHHAARRHDPHLRLVKLGCGGETTLGMIVGDVGCIPGLYPTGSQLNEAVAFLEAHRQTTSFVTIDIGANDILGCVDPATLLLDASCVDAAGAGVVANVTTILDALRAAAPGVPIIGMDYYDVFLGAWVLGPGEDVARADAEMIDAVNADLVATYAAAGASVADVSGAFDSHNFDEVVDTKEFGSIPVNVANICRWTWFCDDTFAFEVHANDRGYRIIARAFLDVLPSAG